MCEIYSGPEDRPPSLDSLLDCGPQMWARIHIVADQWQWFKVDNLSLSDVGEEDE